MVSSNGDVEYGFQMVFFNVPNQSLTFGHVYFILECTGINVIALVNDQLKIWGGKNMNKLGYLLCASLGWIMYRVCKEHTGRVNIWSFIKAFSDMGKPYHLIYMYWNESLYYGQCGYWYVTNPANIYLAWPLIASLHQMQECRRWPCLYPL